MSFVGKIQNIVRQRFLYSDLSSGFKSGPGNLTEPSSSIKML